MCLSHLYTNTLSVLFLYLLLLPTSLGAQSATIAGQVVDAETKEPLLTATVLAGEEGTITDFEGNFILQVEPGTYTLEVSYIGYDTYSTEVSITDGEKVDLVASLTEAATLLNTATVSSSRYEKAISEVTVSLEVLQPQLIQNTGKVSLDDALQKVPGFTVIDGQANIRSGSGYSQGAGSRVLLLVDDIPILTADAGFPNWGDVPIEVIEQVEVVKGAASALYGSSALNGIVNVRTAYAKSDPITKGSKFYTLYQKPKRKELAWWDGISTPHLTGASLSHRQKFGKVDLVVGGYYQTQESFRRNVFNNFGRFNVNVRHRITDRLSYGIAANFNKGESGDYFYWESIENALVGTASTLSTRERTRYNIDPSLLYFDKGGNRHRLLGRFYSVTNDNSLGQGNESDLFYGEYQFQRRMANELVLSAGLVASGTNVNAELYGDTTFTSSNFATYLQVDKKFFDRLNISFGARYEANELKNPGFDYEVNFVEQIVEPSTERESRPVFRLGANYRLTNSTFLRASWGQGYRYPTIAERYIFTNAGGFFITPNPDLGSETGWSAELAVKQGYRLGGFEGFFDLALFQMSYQDMMEFNWAGAGFRSENIGDTEIRGIEATLAGRGTLGSIPFQLLTGYTYANPRFIDFDINGEEGSVALSNAINSSNTDNILKYRFRHTFKFDGELEFGKFRLGAESFYNSSIDAYDVQFRIFIPGLADFQDNNTDGFWIHNVRFAYEHNEKLRASFILGNITNTEYTIRPALMEAPRNLTFRLDYQL